MKHCVGIVLDDNTVATLVGFDEAGNAKFDRTDEYEPVYFNDEASAAAMSINLTRFNRFEYTIIVYDEEQ